LREMRRALAYQFDCTSLDGPVCLKPEGEFAAAQSDLESSEFETFLAREAEAKANQALEAEEEAEDGEESAAGAYSRTSSPGRGEFPRRAGNPESSDQSANPEPVDFATAVRLAAKDIQCELCRAMTRWVWWTVAESARDGGDGGGQERIEEVVLNTCKGQIPPLLQRHSVVPRGLSQGYALGERGEPRSLSGFESAAYKRACDTVVQLADQDMVEAVQRQLRRYNAKRSQTNNKPLDQVVVTFAELRDMQEAACAATRCRLEQSLPVIEEAKRDQSIEEVLHQREDQCIYLSLGWWTYEVCHRKHILQFHVDRHRTVDAILLGRFDQLATTNMVSVEIPHLELANLLPGMRERLPYHSHVFSQGDPCEIEMKKRRTQVRFACPVDGQVHLVVNEPSTCRYVLTLYLPIVCKHPAYRPTTTTRHS